MITFSARVKALLIGRLIRFIRRRHFFDPLNDALEYVFLRCLPQQTAFTLCHISGP